MYVTGDVQVTGSKAQQQKVITLATAVAITDTNFHFYDGGSWAMASGSGASPITEWNNYNNHALLILSSLDQPINLSIESKLRGSSYDILTTGITKTAQTLAIPASGPNSPIYLDVSDLKSLQGIQSDPVSMLLRAGTAPTTGSIIIKLVMWAS